MIHRFFSYFEIVSLCVVSLDYPCPLVSVRDRRPVYGEIGHTIMNLLADFHNYQYMVSHISGLVIHLEVKKTTVRIPSARYDAVSLHLIYNESRPLFDLLCGPSHWKWKTLGWG